MLDTEFVSFALVFLLNANLLDFCNIYVISTQLYMG